MDKKDIKNLLRENLLKRLKEKANAKPKKSKEGDDEESNKDYDNLSSDEKELINTQTIEIQQSVGPGKQLKISQVMDAAGVGDADNAADRSKYTQKVNKRNDRHLTGPEASAMSKVVKNAGAFN
jgi:hypothetical protein